MEKGYSQRGTLPTQVANLDRQHTAFDFVATAVLEDRVAAIHALMTDPLTAVCSAVCSFVLYDALGAAGMFRYTAAGALVVGAYIALTLYDRHAGKKEVY